MSHPKKSLDDLKNIWLPEVKSCADPGIVKAILINKSDLPNKEFSLQEVQMWAQQEGMLVFETSAKTGRNVNSAFLEVCRCLISQPVQQWTASTGGGTGQQLRREQEGEHAKQTGGGDCCA